MLLVKRVVLVLFVVLLSRSATLAAAEGDPPSPIELFEGRIMPIFNSPKPSSCVQCHLSSVDLKDYILPSHEQTFVSLRDQGLIDVEEPRKSKILKLIEMGDQDPDSYARRIHEKMRQAEYEAFSAWIVAACSDSRLRELKSVDGAPAAKPTRPEPIIEFTRKSRVVDSFVRHVWSQRMRCFPCHTPNEIDSNNPKHEKPAKTHADFVKQFGQRMNIFLETPEATVRHLIANSKPKADRLPLINVSEPKNSLLVLKPTSKVPSKTDDREFEKPSQVEPVSHMGGLKMHLNDHSYKSFMAWIEDYAKAAGGLYVSVDDLPSDNWFPTNHTLRMKNAPDEWPVLGSVQLFVHPWNGETSSFESQPSAFTQTLVTPRHVLNGSLFLLASKDAAGSSKSDDKTPWKSEGESLAAGRYLIKAYYDSKRLLDGDPAAFLDESDYVGQIEIEAEWKDGFANAQVIDGAELVK